MKTTGLCAVLLWFATVCPCAAQMMSASQYGEYMRKLDDAATRWQKQLNSVDVEKMKVEYSEGKIIEQGRTETLENLKFNGTRPLKRSAMTTKKLCKNASQIISEIAV
jgi:hypothetical protein